MAKALTDEQLERRRARNRRSEAKRRATKPDEVHAIQRRHRQRHPERWRRWLADWRAKNPNYEREYREQHRDHLNALARRRRRPADQVRRWNRYNHDRRRGSAPTAEAIAYVEEVLVGDPCAYCGAEAPTVDHIEPVEPGRPTEWDDLTMACLPCNASKQRTPLLQFLLRRVHAAR